MACARSFEMLTQSQRKGSTCCGVGGRGRKLDNHGGNECALLCVSVNRGRRERIFHVRKQRRIS